MTIADAVVVVAILVGPLLAVSAQRRIDRVLERKNAKLRIFQVPMATRAARLAPDHVHTLNSIDIEFYGRRLFGVTWPSAEEKAVIAAWNEYRDHLNLPTESDEAQRLWASGAVISSHVSSASLQRRSTTTSTTSNSSAASTRPRHTRFWGMSQPSLKV